MGPFLIVGTVPAFPIEDKRFATKDLFLPPLDPPKEASESSLSDDESTASFLLASPTWAATRCGR